jgi:methylthioribulose-1-phosphate dehydratase
VNQVTHHSDNQSDRRIDDLIRTARDFGQQGWTPATSGNYSVRLSSDRIAMTRSGVHKRHLDRDGLMLVDLDGRPLDDGRNDARSNSRPSAETGLHTQLYRLDPEIGAVLHVHSPAATVASRRYAAAGEIVLADYELLKAFAGIQTHETSLTVPILPNDQDIDVLATSAERFLQADPRPWVYLIAGHGLYAWGRDVGEAARHVEALEFLLACHLLEDRV